MKEIENAQRNWLEAKEKAARSEERKGHLGIARKLDACKMFKGDETLEGVVDLMFSPQGAEFLTRYKFPDLATFRRFRKYDPERLGVHIDRGEISLQDEKRVFLVGKTTARLKYTVTQGNRLVLMHGAKAYIEASGYAIVRIEADDSCEVVVKTNDHAKIMQ